MDRVWLPLLARAGRRKGVAHHDVGASRVSPLEPALQGVAAELLEVAEVLGISRDQRVEEFAGRFPAADDRAFHEGQAGLTTRPGEEGFDEAPLVLLHRFDEAANRPRQRSGGARACAAAVYVAGDFNYIVVKQVFDGPSVGN